MKEIEMIGGLKALVDDEDYPLISKYKWWNLRGNSSHIIYAGAKIHGKNVKMHRLIMNAKPGQMVDHISGIGTDNIKENLRFCTNSQNHASMFWMGRSSSRFRGVSWQKERKKWLAKITVQGKQIPLGRFASEEEAAKAYDKAATEHFGDFARRNYEPMQTVA